MPIQNWQHYFPGGQPTSPPASPPFFPGPSVPPVYDFPFTIDAIGGTFYHIASPGTLPTLPVVPPATLPFFLQSSPTNPLLWGPNPLIPTIGENSANCFVGPLYSPELVLTFGNGTAPTRPFPWGSGHDPYRVWKLINAIANITNEPSPSMPGIFPDYPDIKMIVVGYNAIPCPVDYDYTQITTADWTAPDGLHFGYFNNAPAYYWATGLSIGFYSAFGDGSFGYEQTEFFYPGAKDLIVHAGANPVSVQPPSTAPFYWWGLNEFSPPGWPYYGDVPIQNDFTDSPGYGVATVGPAWAVSPFATVPVTGWQKWGNSAPQRIVPATNDYTVQKPKVVSVLGTPLPFRRWLRRELILQTYGGGVFNYPWLPPDITYEANGPLARAYDLAANGDIVQSQIVVTGGFSWGAPAFLFNANPFTYFYGPTLWADNVAFILDGYFDTFSCSVTTGSYQPPITQVSTNGGKTFYVL